MPMRNPDAFEPELEGVLEFADRSFVVVERQKRNTHEPRIVSAKIRHRAVVRARRLVALTHRVLLGQRNTFGKRGEYQLSSKPQHIERLAALVAIECTQRRI